MNNTNNFQNVKTQAAGRCGEIITALTALPAESLTKGPKDHPCPICGGASVLFPDVRAGGPQQHGKVNCRKCTDGKPTGDIIDTVHHWGEYAKQSDAAKAIADYLGIDWGGDPSSGQYSGDIVETVAKAKKMPADSFRRFGAKAAKRGRAKLPCARVDVYDAKGEIHSYFDIEPGGKGKFKRGEGSSGMFFPGQLPQRGETWHLVEGVKDAAALDGIGLLAAGLPRADMPAEFAELFRGCDVVILPDLDTAGQNGAKKTGGRLLGFANVVSVARLPGELRDKAGDDVRDVISKSGHNAVLTAISNAEELAPAEVDEFVPDSDDGRPVVVLDHRHDLHIDEVLAYIGTLQWALEGEKPSNRDDSSAIYERGGLLVNVIEEQKPDGKTPDGRVKIAKGTARIRQLPPAVLDPIITGSVCLQRRVKKDDDFELVNCAPPRWLVEGIHKRGHYAGLVLKLEGIATAPTLRPDGSILQTPGHDAETGLIYRPTINFGKVPADVRKCDAQHAASQLTEIVRDFPFQSEHDKAAWLAMLLSMIARPAISGQVPLFAVTANVRGSGKSMLVDVASIIAYGHTAARTAYVARDDEMRKQITSVAMEGSPAVLIDNIDRLFGSASLDAVLTSGRWHDRVLGENRTIDLEMKTIWTATGNNLAFRSDLSRRVLPIRLDSPLEAPETRADFRVGDLLDYTRKCRAGLVSDALLILRGYFAAGCPNQKGKRFGSFDQWNRIIRGAVVWAGLPDPLATLEYAKQNDEAGDALRLLVSGLLEMDNGKGGLTTAEIIQRLNDTKENPETHSEMREVVSEHLSRPDARQLGYLLRKYANRRVGNCKITKSVGHNNQKRWKAVVTGGDGAYGGNAGTKGIFDPVCHPRRHTTQKNSSDANMLTIDPITPACPECDSPMDTKQEETNGQNIAWHICTDRECGRMLRELSQ